MEFKLVRHKDCSEKLLSSIVRLKNEYWHYSFEDHCKWIDNNNLDEDIHLCLWNDGVLCGYLFLTNIVFCCDNDFLNFVGIGNVCVTSNERNKGYGVLLMKIVEYYLIINRRTGVLLCNTKLLPFYSKVGWQMFEGDLFYNESKVMFTLFASVKLNYSQIVFYRNF